MPSVYYKPNNYLSQKEHHPNLPVIVNQKLSKFLIALPPLLQQFIIRRMRIHIFPKMINHRHHKKGSNECDDDEGCVEVHGFSLAVFSKKAQGHSFIDNN